MANYRYTYESGGRRYEIDAPQGATAADLQAIVDGSSRTAATTPPPAAAAPKPKPKKKEESFLSGVIPTFTGAVGDLASTLGLGLQQAAPYLGTTSGIASPLLSLAGVLQKDVGKKIKTESDAYLPEASKQGRIAQQKYIKEAKPGLGSQALSVFSRAAAANPTVGRLAREFLPQTPVEAARSIATVQAPFQTARGASEFVASQLPATLLPMGGGKAVQLVGKRFLPVAGREAAEAALARQVGIGVTTAGGTINAVDAGSQAYSDVLEKGGTQEEADRAFKIAAAGAGVVSGAATKIPGLEQLAFAEKPARGGILRSAGRAVIGEAPQEFVEEAGSKLATNVAKLGTAAEVPIGEDVLSSGVLGGIGGGIMAAPLGGLQGLANRGAADDGTPPPPASSRPSRPPPPPPPPPADMGALSKALGPVGGKIILQEPSGPQEYTYQGMDEDGGVILADADGVVFSEDPDQVQAAIKAGAVESESGLGGMAFGMDITEGLPDVVTSPPPPPPPPAAPVAPVAAAPVEPIAPVAVQEPVQEPPAIEAPSPKNTQGQSKVGNVIFDQEKGVGQVPLNQNVKYRGFTAMMRPSKFLELAADIDKPKQSSLNYIRESVDEGKGVGSPFLQLDFKTGKIKGHDGRHRMMVIQEKNGDEPVPVHIFGEGEGRARSLDKAKISAFGSSLTSERGNQSTNNFSEAFLEDAVVPVTAPVAEEPEFPPPPPERVRTVTTPGGSKVNTAFEVVDAANLTAATGDLQNRDRSRASTDLQVQDIFSNFDPVRLGESLESDRGSPIVGPDNTVESGNGRVMAINKVYDESPEKAAAYRKFIEDQGFDLSGIDRPILVRRRTDRMTPDQRSKFVRESNMDTKLQLSTSEKAQTDAASLTPDVMGLMASPDVNASANQGFVRAFLSKLPAQEQAAFLDKDGRLSAEGSRRLRTAVKSSAYGDADLINTLDESQDNNIKSVGGALEDVAPAWRRLLDAIKEGDVSEEMDTTKQLVEAAKIVRDVRNQGTKIADFLAQDDAFNPLDPITERFIRSFYNESLGRAAGREAIADVLDKYARRASEQTTSEGLFENEQMSPTAILDRILEERGSGAGQSNMFASIETPRDVSRQDIEEIRKVPSLRRGLKKLIKYKDEQLIDDAEFAKQVTDLKDYVDYMQEAKNYRLAKKGRARGADRVLSEMLKARRAGNIDPDSVDFMMWALNANPNLADGLAISIVKPEERSPAGDYDPVTRVMSLFKSRASDTTAVHELLHHTERMMPTDIQDAIRTTWLREFNKQEKKAKSGTFEKAYFRALRAFHSGEQITVGKDTFPSRKGLDIALNLIGKGYVPYSLYQYVNPSEFWAVNATEIMQKRFDVGDSMVGRLRNWLSEFVERAKGLFNLSAKSPLLKALDSLAKADGKFNSQEMLDEEGSSYMDVTPIDEKRAEKDFKELKALVDDLAKAMEQESFGIPQMQRKIVSALDEALNSLDGISDNAAPEFSRKIESLERKIQNLKAIAGASLKPANENKLETEVQKAERELEVARQALSKAFDDDRAYMDRRTKERKAYEKELDQLEKVKDESFAKWDKLYREESAAIMMALTNGTPDQMRNAVAKAQKPNDKVIDQGADLQKENRGCD